ncbi:RNA polymerase Rpb4 family protein [Coccidioides posadasii C735 delta SOWgp]|nr:RNA polymerase Rpb4 family protein [Coccidioides posadasii C735 delta SOWgp]EER28734.1 RNA polymerase Rpb4 family protein [Coccidioides posadasii C735 delta SOWgp]|eukprot:XP_003070879.1 RNA polymerase Rpb4 family protein [Coccidioides posadasii C735 delta SOWgp]
MNPGLGAVVMAERETATKLDSTVPSAGKRSLAILLAKLDRPTESRVTDKAKAGYRLDQGYSIPSRPKRSPLCSQGVMSSTPVPDPTHRKRELPQNELEASSQLKLGEFQNVPTLSLSEARLVINKVLDLRKKSNNKYEERETLIKTQDYLEVFARFKEKENIEAVERLLSAHTELEFFERSQLGSLCCDNAEEAKALIPSIGNKISDADLQELLDELTKLRNFVE